jgi:hypothetical protein
MSSGAIKLGAVVVLSTLVVAFCAAQDDYEEVNAECVDTNNVQPDGSYTVVDEDFCDDDDHHTHYVGSHGAYRWYYGGTARGGRVSGGTTLKPDNAQVSTRSGRVIQRGGFGSHGSSGGG